VRCSIQVGGSLAGHEIIKSAATPVSLARCPARGRGQVHEALSLSAPLTTTLGGASGLAGIRWHAVHVRLSATARSTMTTRGSGIQGPTVRARRLRHDDCAQTDASAWTVADEPCGSCTGQRKTVRLSFLHLAAPRFPPRARCSATGPVRPW
jgi:hypothetical protein